MSNKWWVLTAVGCGTFMATLDSSIVNIALPTLVKGFDSNLSQIKWVIIVYLLVITCFLLPFGRLSDQYGRKRVFLLGFLVFTIGSALCGSSPALSWLIIARIVQGLGAAMLMANGPAIITKAFPQSERGAALGTLAMVVSTGLVTGPSVGGFLVTHLNWQSIFLLNIPIGMLGIFLGYRKIPRDLLAQMKTSFDWLGAVLQTVVLICCIAFFDPPAIHIGTSGSPGLLRVAFGVATVLLLALFIKVENRAPAPVFDPALLKIRTYWTANLASFFTFVAYSSVQVLMPFFLEEVLHYTPERAGRSLTAIPLTVLVVAPISGRLADRVGSRGLSFAGAAIGATVLFLMSGALGIGIDEKTGRIAIILALCGIGLATGLFQSPNNTAIMSAVPVDKLGVASALLATVRNLGLVTGTGLATAIFTWQHRLTNDFVRSIHFTFFIAGTIGMGAMIASMGRRGREAPSGQLIEKRGRVHDVEA